MDLEAFYEADERRRASPEVEIGRDWRDAAGVRYELSWVEDTGELYAMREPEGGSPWVTPFGDWVAASLPAEAQTVRVLAHLATRDELERVLQGWQQEMEGPNSIGWVLGALHEAGVRPEGSPTRGGGSPQGDRPGPSMTAQRGEE